MISRTRDDDRLPTKTEPQKSGTANKSRGRAKIFLATLWSELTHVSLFRQIVAGVITGLVLIVVSMAVSLLLTRSSEAPDVTPVNPGEPIVTSITPVVSVPTTTPTSTSRSGIEICEVLADPPGDEPDDEKIVLCNYSDQSVPLGGWMLKDNYGAYVIPDGETIAARTDDQPGQWSVWGRTYNPTGRRTKAIFLANKGDFVALVDPSEVEIHRVHW